MNETELNAQLAEAEQKFATLHAEHEAVRSRLDSLRSAPHRDEWAISETKEELDQTADRARNAELKLTRLRIEELQAQLPAAIAAVEPKKATSDEAFARARAAQEASNLAAFEYHEVLGKVDAIESSIDCFRRRVAELQAVADKSDALEQDATAARLTALEETLMRARA